MTVGRGVGPSGRVPFSRAVKRSLAVVAGLAIITGLIEWYMLQNPEQIAPISWSFWWLYENARWLAPVLAALGGALYSHFFFYRRVGDFWYPMTRTSSAIIASATLGSLAATQAWWLLAFMAAFMFSAVLAHCYWYRLENFDEHREQFHDN